MENLHFRSAKAQDLQAIWSIIQQAILRRKKDGSNQWQDGYPNPEVLKRDLNKGSGFVLCIDRLIVGYTAILINDEPEYKKIEGSWVTNSD